MTDVFNTIRNLQNNLIGYLDSVQPPVLENTSSSRSIEDKKSYLSARTKILEAVGLSISILSQYR